MEREFLALHKSKSRETDSQGFQRESRLQLAKRGTQAIMNAESKSERLRRIRAMKVEGVGFREDRCVATGCSEPQKQLGAFRQI